MNIPNDRGDVRKPPEALACPTCAARLVLSGARISCANCRDVGEVRREVWDFVRDRDYAATFGDQWQRYSETQLDSRNGTTISRDQFERITGWRDLRGRTVLDAGCGAGRYSEVALSMGARLVSMDLSEAAYVTRQNLPESESSVVVRGSLFAPPLAPAAFDDVFCIGVIQHTPDPLGVIAPLVRALKPGGRLAIWMYERRWYLPLMPRMLMRHATSRMPNRMLRGLVRGLVTGFTPAARLVPRVPSRSLRKLATAALPIASYWGSLPLTADQQVQWSLLDTHDWLSPRYDLPQNFADVRAALESAGGVEIERVAMPGLAIRARRGERLR